MVDVARSPFPPSMSRSLDEPSVTDFETAVQGAVESVKRYAREDPVRFGLIAVAVGFVLGWRLKPW